MERSSRRLHLEKVSRMSSRSHKFPLKDIKRVGGSDKFRCNELFQFNLLNSVQTRDES